MVLLWLPAWNRTARYVAWSKPQWLSTGKTLISRTQSSTDSTVTRSDIRYRVPSNWFAACGWDWEATQSAYLKPSFINSIEPSFFSITQRFFQRLQFAKACSRSSFFYFGLCVHPNNTPACAWRPTAFKSSTLIPHGLNTNRRKRPPPSTLIFPYCVCATRIAAIIRE